MSDTKDIRDLFAYDDTEWKPIRDAGTIDMHYVSGDPWTEKERRDREKAGRPCLSADELSQYVNQVVNEVRSNKRAVKFSPIGNGANDQTAEFYADKMREIEYRSRAQIAYTTAFQNAVERSYGFVRVCNRYLYPTATASDLYIDTIPNPNLVTPDACALMPDMSDQSHCWVREAWPTDQFNKRWAKFKISKFTDAKKTAPNWISESKVFVGEYWQIKTTKRTLLIVNGLEHEKDTRGVWKDDYDASRDGAVLDEREEDAPTVISQLTNGIDILEKTDWPGRYIPIVSCYGKVIYVQETGTDKRQILSMVRLARDPQKMIAYLGSAEAELIGMTPKFPYFVYEGQLAAKELALLAKSNHEPVPVIKVKPSVDGLQSAGGPLPFPQRNPFEPQIQPIEIAREAWRRAVQSAMGQTPLPTAAQRRNEKSGVALKHIDELGQRGSFHFTDHYLDMITQVGVIVEDLMGHTYDTPRDVGVRAADDSSSIIRINDPKDPESVSTKGDHLVTVSTGPSFESERTAGSEFADTIVTSPMMEMMDPPKRPKLLAQAIKLKNLGAIGDAMVKIIDPEPSPDGQPTPDQVQQLVAENQQLKQAMQHAGMVIQTKQVEQRGKLEIAQAQDAGKFKIAALQESAETERNQANNEVKLAVAELSGKFETLANSMQLFFDERARVGAHVIDQKTAHDDRAHELGMSALEHQRALEAGQMAHAQNLDAQAQSAALAPPSNGGGA